MKKIAVIGAGSWGTALAVMLEQDGHDVTLWARNAEAAENMKQTRENKQYLNCIKLVSECKNRLKANANFDMTIDNLVLKMWEEVNESSCRHQV